MNYWKINPSLMILGVLALLLVAIVACGTSTAPTPQPQATSPAPGPGAGMEATPAPTAEAAPTAMPPKTPGSAGTINSGMKETGIFEGHPRFSSSPRIQFISTSLGEGMVAIQPDLSPGPMLAASWSISDDFLTWTWNLQHDVQFHKGYGEMTAEDVLYSYQQFHEGALHARAGVIGDFWVGNEGGSQEIIDDHTIKVNTGRPWVSPVAFEFMRSLGGSSTWIVSKKQSEEMGAEAASKEIAGTGPWQIEEHSSGEWWKFSAVQDHWRQTPYFDELVLWSIPEEAARVAGFQTGKLDTFDMAFDTIPTVESVQGAELVAWPNAGQAGLNIYGQTYGTDTEGNPYQSFDTNHAWVSANPDPDSEEWDKARKVRLALAIAIDRQAIVDTLLSGFGGPLYFRDWMGHEGRADPSWVHEYDPERAKQLLVDAGYPNGFQIALTPAIRGAPAEVEACEAVAQYWEAVGVDVNLQKIPYATLRPEIITRNYQGATCHTVSMRLTPIIGASNYVKKSTFSYGTEHPWMEERITDALQEVDPVKQQAKETEVADWMFKNVMAFGIYSHDGVWPVGKRLDPEFTLVDYSEVRVMTSYEYIKPR